MSQVNDRHQFDLQYSKSKLLISGSDEVGRGAMAGPVCVASCILPNDYDNPLIRDSKKLSAHQREKLFDEIIKVAIDYRIIFISNEMVDKWNPKKSSRIGMIETIKRLDPKPDLCLIDGENIPDQDGYKFVQLIKGDNKSQTIGAASILAKVSRDRLMYQYGKIYPGYGFEHHVGYVTKQHVEATTNLGVLPIHRKSYAPIKRILEKKKKRISWELILFYFLTLCEGGINMNNVNMMGTVEGDAEVIYSTPEGDKHLYKFVLKIPRPYKNKKGSVDNDFINVKVWSNAIADEFILHDQAQLALEGRINSFTSKDMKSNFNDVYANRVFYVE